MTDPVLDLLKSKEVAFSISGKDYVTKCFNPDHEDTNPSFRIDKTTGIAHCFSCGYKLNIFRYYGILTNTTPVRVAKLKEKIATLRESTVGLPPLKGSSPYNEVFRNISVKTLREFGACKTSDIPELELRIVFPITDIRGRVSVYVGRHTKSNAGLRYAMYPAGASVPLYPNIFHKKHSSIVLVEGIFDMLNLYDKGLQNVVCTFGTSGLLNNTTEKLFPYKVQGVTHVYIAYDGDAPGREASAKLLPLIQEAGYITEILELEDDKDPGDLSQEDVNNIIKHTQ